MPDLAYNVRYSVVPVNSSLLTVTLYPLVVTALVYNDISLYQTSLITSDILWYQLIPQC
jgi:hypothetical protein